MHRNTPIIVLASANEIHRAVSGLTVAQIRAYRIILTADFGHAAAFAAGLADCVEHEMILAVLSALPDESPVADVLGIVATTKWVAVATAVVLLGVRLCSRNYRAPTPQP